MITTVTLNPTIDRAYFINENQPGEHKYIYENQNVTVSPGGKGLLSAIDLKRLGYDDVQNIALVGGKQGLFFESMVQKHNVITNYVYTDNEIRNNIFIVADQPVSYTHYNDYTYQVEKRDVQELIKRYIRGIVDSKCVMISGSIPDGVGFDIYKRLIKIANEKDKIIYLHASGEALNQALEGEPKFVAPYFKHTDKILDKKVKSLEDYIEAGHRLQESGAEYVLIPFHSNRLIFSQDEAHLISAPDFNLVNWLGAGEAYNAAFINYIIEHGFDFIKANKYAGAAALAIAEKRRIYIEDEDEIEKMLSKIKVESVG
ncbi:MAG: PfkB family carbohydrate kinase [Halanaerobacter sp.]